VRGFRDLSIFVFSLAALLLLALIAQRPAQVGAASTSLRFPPTGYILDSPTLTIAGATATTAPTSVTGVTSVQIQWIFGTVSGSYSGCTVQGKTTLDGVNWLTLGGAASVTVTSNTLNAWRILLQAPATSGVTVTTPSSSAAAGFGDQIEYTFACSGYGTQAPVTIKALYQ
jgi:hypothetical protein